ncbi:hypothetical protein C7431_11140 [Pantoea allii]|uniref:Uncharacterized protein n=1 Tax=Pantoea allii TaxID=574096 RepID=A0A2V2BCG4_9GAMM|nr:hypothetical protein C7431_11140 [Pantoea allii]
MKSVIQEKILTLFLCVAVTAVIVKFISKSSFYVSHPSLSISLTVAVAVIISNVVVTKIISKRG